MFSCSCLTCSDVWKDVQGFFAFPVNDAIAPGYSRVIDKPMDFSTIRTKIDTHHYSTIEAFRDDFHLMCNNATVYNAPETIYYKASKRLLQIGEKMLTQDKLRNMYRSMGIRVSVIDSGVKDLSDEPIDVDTIDSDHPIIPLHITKKKPKSSKSDTRPSVVGRKILAQVQAATKRVSAQLKEKYPNSKIGFLRRNKDGTTSLAFVNPDSAPESLPVNLGTTTGKVSSGSQITTGFKEDKKNKATPVSYLMYGSFGSFAPTYDSSRATITKEESDLLLTTYGNDVGVHYAQSIQDFVKDTSSFAHGVVDKLLDVLTDGAHSKYINRMQEKAKLIQEVKHDDKKSPDSTAKDDGAKTAAVPIDIKSLLSLSELGIDVSFLKDIVEGKESSKKEVVISSSLMDQLNSTGRLLEDLQEAQNSRLSSRPGDPLSATPDTATKPSEKEQSIANRLTDTLKDLTSQVAPGALTEVDSLRAAIGVGPVALSPADMQNVHNNSESGKVASNKATSKPIQNLHTTATYTTATSIQRPPLYNGHLYTTATSIQRPPLYNGHLYTTATSTQRPPLHNGHLYTTATSTQRPPLHYDHLYTTATSTQRPPLHNGHLPTTTTSVTARVFCPD
ncbi:hypothetical protein QZH41_014539, partial [Actinostola sp. cb2023]